MCILASIFLFIKLLGIMKKSVNKLYLSIFLVKIIYQIKLLTQLCICISLKRYWYNLRYYRLNAELKIEIYVSERQFLDIKKRLLIFWQCAFFTMEKKTWACRLFFIAALEDFETYFYHKYIYIFTTVSFSFPKCNITK